MTPEAGTTTGTEPTPAASGSDPRQVAMEEERDFLIRSLHDLESERAAGDIDQADYETLRDDYTVRAAALLRRLEDPELGERTDEGDPLAGAHPACDGTAGATSPGDPADPAAGGRATARRRRPWRRREKVAVAAIVVSLAGLVGWQIGQAASHRSAGETITGANVSGNSLSLAQVDQLLIQAESEAATNPVGAVQLYGKILAVFPDQPQALTEQGWLYAQAGALSQAATQLRHAETASASYDPAHGYLGIVLFGEKDYAGAVSELTYYLAHGPNPALIAQATQALKAAKVDEAATATSSSTTVSP